MSWGLGLPRFLIKKIALSSIQMDVYMFTTKWNAAITDTTYTANLIFFSEPTCEGIWVAFDHSRTITCAVKK